MENNNQKTITEILNQPYVEMQGLIEKQRRQKIEDLKQNPAVLEFCKSVIQYYYPTITIYKQTSCIPFTPQDIEIYEMALLEIFQDLKQFEGYDWNIQIVQNNAYPTTKNRNIYRSTLPTYGVEVQLKSNEKSKTLNLK